jgi:hypothetical protein
MNALAKPGGIALHYAAIKSMDMVNFGRLLGFWVAVKTSPIAGSEHGSSSRRAGA